MRMVSFYKVVRTKKRIKNNVLYKFISNKYYVIGYSVGI